MIRVAVFVVTLVGVSWVQMRYLAPVNTKKEWAVFLCIMVLAAAVGTSLILDLALPSPMSGVRGIIEPIGRRILH